MSNFAWVTLATNDSYSLGALVVANSLKKVNTSHQLVVLITPGVSESMKSKLEATFNVVVDVNVLDSKDEANLALLSRPELGITFTKLHCWRLTQFEKCVFLDADTFVLQNCDELFDREELSAAPDVGWPDCFNSGVFVFRPSLDTFGKLIEFATKQGSFDGGDQGLLNSYFSDWAQKDISKHLPFIYNTCSTACYSYLPAFKQFGQNVKILHFIGQVKPWLLNFDSSSKTVYAPEGYGHIGEYLQQWWNIFCSDVHPSLTTEMTTSAHQQYSDEIQWYQNLHFPIPSQPNPPQIEFIDPWDTYYQTSSIPTESELHDRFIQNKNENVEYLVPPSNHEQNHDSFHCPNNNVNTINREDHQHNHNENANVDSPYTITEPHISIRSSSINESDSIFHESRTQEGDTSNHSININSFLTFNHDNSHANTSESPSIGRDEPEHGERERESFQNENHKDDVENVNETSDNREEGGLAGALAQLTLGSPRSAEQQAYEESMRRQCWEAGKIDYLGKDSFDNIWKRITKTIETKTDTPSAPPPEKTRSSTPQPDEKLAVEEKKEVKIGPSFNESEEDASKPTQIHEQTITEVTPDGRIIEKKIVTYPGEETTEIEEIEEVDGQTMSVKRSIIASENKEVQPKPETETELKNESVVLVPGYRTVEFDEKTNSTIVKEKTTTGYQQTITTVQEDGTKKIQTKTFFDPVEIPGEEVEEETYEETETFETTVTPITGAKDAVENLISKKDSEVEITEVESKTEEQTPSSLVEEDQTATVVKSDKVPQQSVNEIEIKEAVESKALTDLKNQPIVIVPGHQKVEFNKETNTTTVTEKTTTGYQETITTVTPDGRTIVQTKVFYDPIPSEVEEVEETETTTTTTTTTDSTDSAKNIHEVQKTTVEKVTEEPSIQTIKQDDTTSTTTDAKDLQLVQAGPTSLTQKKTTSEGKEIEVTTTVSDDGKTKTLRKTVRQPSEEIEIEEYEETETFEPGEVKVVTTTKTLPLVEALEEAAKDIVDTTKTVVETKQTIVDPSESSVDTNKNTQVVAQQEKDSKVETSPKATTATKQTTTSTEVKQTTTDAKQTTTEAKQTTTEAKQTTTTDAKQTTTEAKQTTTTEAKQTTTTEAKPTKTEVKQTKTNEAKPTKTEAKQTTTTEAKPTTTTEAKPTTTEAKPTTTEAKQTTTEAKQTTTASKQTTTAAKQSTTDAKQTKTDAKQTTTAFKQTTSEAKQTTTAAKQTTTAAKQTTTEAKQTTAEAKKTTTEAKQTTTTAKQTTAAKTTEALTQAKPTATETKPIKKDTKSTKTDTEASTKTVTGSKISDSKNTTQTATGKATTATSKKDDTPSKSKVTTGVTKKDSAVKTDNKTSTKTSTSTSVATIDKPKVTTKNGETTTEVVRRVPGGTEHTWTTVKADGTTKTESKTLFDTVEVEGSDEEEEEYEEYEEIVEDEPVKTVTTKKTTQAPVAVGTKGTKGPKTPTVTEATPPNTPPLKPLVIGGPSALKAEHEIPDTPPLDKVEQLRKKKLQSAPSSKAAPKVEKAEVEAPKPPPRKKEVKKPATGN